MTQYSRPEMDRVQDLVTAAYGGPVNPTQDVNGKIELHNPLDDKVLAWIEAGQVIDVKSIQWADGVEHNDNRATEGFKGWAPYTNSTETTHKPTPDNNKPDTSDGTSDAGPDENPSESAETEELGADEVPSGTGPDDTPPVGTDALDAEVQSDAEVIADNKKKS